MEERAHALHIVLAALHMDDNGEGESAYLKYLESIQVLSGYLLQDANRNGLPGAGRNTEETKKALSVVRQCLDRVEALLSASGSRQPASPAASVADPSRLTDDAKLACQHAAVQRSGNRTDSGLLALSNQQDEESIEVYNEIPPVRSRQQMTPLAKAKRDNALLRRAYQARMAHTADPIQKANLRLELQRRLAENNAVAQIHQREYLRDQEWRERRALEEATRKLAQSGEVVTREEEEKQQLYARILRYEDSEDWPAALRQRLENHPGNPQVVEHVVRRTLRAQDHPLAQWMCGIQSRLLDRIHPLLTQERELLSQLPCDLLGDTNPLVANGQLELPFELPNSEMNHLQDMAPISFTAHNGNDETRFDRPPLQGNDISSGQRDGILGHMQFNSLQLHLDTIVLELSLAMETILQMLSLTYEPLSADDAMDPCYRATEDCLFHTLWPPLFALFRLVNRDAEIRVARAMRQLQNCSPEDLGVPPHLCHPELPLYSDAVTRLRSLPSQQSLLAKLKVLVQVALKLCEAGRQDEAAGGSGRPLGADDLVPVLSYALVRTGLPQLVTECVALEQLIDHRFQMGEEGYCLTTLLMALKFLETLP